MSNLHSPSGFHGLDDEFDRRTPSRCQRCWKDARTKFFDPTRRPRRGVTLNQVYLDTFLDNHSDGNSH